MSIPLVPVPRSRRAAAPLMLAFVLAAVPPAMAQKNSGPLLPLAPAAPVAPAPVRPAAPRPMAPAAVPPQPGPAGTNPDAERLSRTLPLDPQTRELRDAVPPDRVGTERRLGLREPRGPATDMRNRTPTPREIVDALAPR